MRQDYVDAIVELQRAIPPECLALLLGQVLAGDPLEAPDRELVGKVHELAAVSRARRLTPSSTGAALALKPQVERASGRTPG